MSDADVLLLKATIELAERGRFTCAPNPTVGCIIVRNGSIIGRGYHAVPGQGHAEVCAIEDAGGQISGATVYVSLEPCAFVGRTPACAQTLIDQRVERVVIAMLDPHAQVSGRGVAMLSDAGVQVDLIELPEAEALIRGYVLRETESRPLVRLKTATSLDGAVALANGESKWITGPASRTDVQYWRARSDAIVTGVGTVLADNPALTVREYEHAKAPLRVVLDSSWRTPADAVIMDSDAPTLIVHRPDVAVPPHGESVQTAAIDPHQSDKVLNLLAEQGCNEILVEAGSGVLSHFLKKRIWDEWIAYIAPKYMGAAAQSVTDLKVAKMEDALQVEVMEVTEIGADLRLRLVPKS